MGGLTAKAVEAARPQARAYKLADGAGLYLFVSPTGAKSWRANYQRAGKQATRTYGRWPDVSLADARRAHAAARDAAEAQALAPRVPTFEEVARAWLRLKLPTLSNGKHQIQVANTLDRFVLPALGSRPIDTLRRAELVAVVQAVQADGKIETAHRVAGRITAVFDYAVNAGHLESHPAAGLVRVLQARKTKKPMASIAPAEAGALLRAIDDYDEPVTRLGMQLLAHTFVRVGELRGMRWDELREDGAVWVVPAERMKLRLPHVVPLSSQAQAVLASLRLLTGDGASSQPGVAMVGMLHGSVFLRQQQGGRTPVGLGNDPQPVVRGDVVGRHHAAAVSECSSIRSLVLVAQFPPVTSDMAQHERQWREFERFEHVERARRDQHLAQGK